MSRAAERTFSTHTTVGREPRPAFDGYSIDWRVYSEASRAGHGAAFIEQVEATSTRSVVGTVEGAGKERFGFVRGIARNKARTLVAAVGLTSVGVGIASNYDGPNDSAPAVFTQSISQNEPGGPSVDVSTTLAKQVETPKAAEMVAPAVSNLALQAEQTPTITRSSQLTDEQANLVMDMVDGRADGITEAVVSVKNGNGGYDTRDWALARTIDKVIDKNADPGALFKPEDPSINGALRWADFTTVAKSADGADYAKGGIIHDGDKLQVDTQSLVATFKAADFKLAPEVITGLSISAKTNLTEAQINVTLDSLGIISGSEKVAPVTVSIPAITTEGAITSLQSGAQDKKTGAEAGTQSSSVNTEKSTETEDLRYKSDKFTLLGVESSNDGTTQIRIVPDSNTDQEFVLKVSQQDAKILAEDQAADEQKGNVVKIDAFEANNRINYVYRRAGNEIRLYSQDTPARAAALKAEIDAKKAEEESFWQYYQTLILLGVVTAAIGAGLMTARRTRGLGATLFTGSVLGIPGAIAALETQSLPTYPVAVSVVLMTAVSAIYALKSKGGEVIELDNRRASHVRTTGRVLAETA